MKRAVVIGAGASGLPAIKSCLEEGFQVVCYEQTPHLGGVWRYKEEVQEDTASVFSSVVVNVNKEMMAYSDYPPPLTFPTYPRHFQWLEYLESYAKHYRLIQYIKFEHKVLQVVKTEDYQFTGRWKVDVCDVRNNQKVYTECFDYVMVCSGHHIYPKIPEFPGQLEFQGKIIHSKEYRKPETFREQRVVVVGFGNSAVDIACDISSTARQTYLSTRRKGWIIPRVLRGSQLTVSELYRKSFTFPYNFLPESFLLRKEESLCNSVFNHEWINIKPDHNIAAQRPVINDFLPMNIVNGSVLLKRGIREIRPNGIVFEGEDNVTVADVIILGTGFNPLFPFLKGMENANDYIDTMYKFILPARLDHHTLAFIGLIDPDYAIPVCAEMQSRWAARVFSGNICLPAQNEMVRTAQAVQEKLKKTCYEGFSQKTMTHGPPYVEELAGELGAKPNLIKWFIKDFRLFCGIFFGPLLPYQFRVQGPHAWEGAKEAILGAEKRDVYNLTRGTGTNTRKKSNKKICIVLIFSLLLGAKLSWNFCNGKGIWILPLRKFCPMGFLQALSKR